MPSSSPPDGSPSSAPESTRETAEAKAASHLRMRARGVRDLAVLRAFELVSRQTFVADRHRDRAMRDLAVPIDCGQTLDEPWLIARMIEALDVRPGHRVLQIGAGSGYATAILAQLAGDVAAFERYRSLATAAQARLAALGVTNARVAWGDGLAVRDGSERFDRILVHGRLDPLPARLLGRLAEGGAMVCARPAGDGQQIVRVTMAGADVTETPVCPCRMQAIQDGLASTL